MLTHRHRTILGDIPADWDAKPLKSLITAHFAGDWGDDEGEQAVSVLRSTNFTNDGQLDFSDIARRYFPKIQADQFGLLKGDLLVERSGGGPEQPVGRIGFIEGDIPGSTVSNFVQVLRPDAEKVDTSFLGWALFELQRSGIVERVQQQSTQMRNLNWRDYQRLMLPWPTIEEQNRIAQALKLCDEGIRKARAELSAKQEMKRSLLDELLSRGLPGRHSSFIQTKRLAYPESWSLKRLKGCGTWTAGGTPDRENVSYYTGPIPWVKSGEVNYSVILETEEHISPEGAEQTTCGLLPVGTLLIAMYGAGVTRGRVALLGVEASTNQAVAAFNAYEGIENEFVYYWFERNYERVRAWAAGSNQDNLSGYLLKNLPIALPEHDEQVAIVELLKAADVATRATKHRVDALQDLKRSLLQNLLAGKIRIPEGAIHA